MERKPAKYVLTVLAACGTLFHVTATCDVRDYDHHYDLGLFDIFIDEHDDNGFFDILVDF